MDDDWDLHAVVRGCAAAASASTSSDANTTSSDHQLFSADFHQDLNTGSVYCQDLFEPRREGLFDEDLHDLYKPFFQNSQIPAAVSSKSLPISTHSVLGGFQDPSLAEQQQQQQQLLQQTRKQQSFCAANSSKASVSHNPSPRSSKRRKNNLKRICHVPAENLSSDMWSWRKYGQKPIKGSPYPRGYYKCSTLKGCMARKQVERNRSDPAMFILTYTGDHNHPMPTHRNSLAGCTRQKPAPANPTTENFDKPSCSPGMSPPASLSLTPEKFESSLEDFAEAEDDDLSASDDDFLAGLEDLAGPTAEGDANDHFWLVDGSTTAAGGGG